MPKTYAIRTKANEKTSTIRYESQKRTPTCREKRKGAGDGSEERPKATRRHYSQHNLRYGTTCKKRKSMAVA